MYLYISFAYFTYAFPEWKRGKKTWSWRPWFEKKSTKDEA
jgi:hypothetical protein